MCRHSLMIKAIAALVFACAIAVLMLSGKPAEKKFSLAPPTEVTPEIIAMRACIEGVAHPSEAELSFGAQLEGCNDWVAIDIDAPVEARIRDRVRHLSYNGTTPRHKDLALRDYDTLVRLGDVTPHLLSKRAKLLIFHRNDFQAGLDDAERGLEMMDESYEARYLSDKTAQLLLLRASARLGMVYTQHDDALLALVEQDVTAIFARNPQHEKARKLQEIVRDYQRARAREIGRPVHKG